MEGNLRLEIKNPCQADWSKMSPVETGRYCSQCEKTVLDFSALSKEEIIEKLSNTKSPLCIKALKTEIDQSFSSSHEAGALRGFGLAASLLLFGAVTSGYSSAIANLHLNSLHLHGTVQGVPNEFISKNTPVADSNKVMIRGTVKDSISKLPLEYVTVYIKGTGIGVLTDTSGNFSFEIPKDYQGKALVLQCDYIGFYSKEINIGPEDLSTPHIINLVEANHMMGEVLIKKYPRKKAWQFWR